jgi:hypothetical protein
MDWWRISKYDPTFRDQNGVYQQDEWTDVTDIGRAFDGMTLDLQTYLATEAAYVASVREFMVDANVTTLRVAGLEPPSFMEVLRDHAFPDAADLERLAGDLESGRQVSGAEIDRVCRLNLRNVLWCRLENPDRFVVEVGPSTTSISGRQRLLNAPSHAPTSSGCSSRSGRIPTPDPTPRSLGLGRE